ncbi:MAG: 4-hydroxy-tetrahydrodipicolinate reductase [Alphaproteobacteria bacterium]
MKIGITGCAGRMGRALISEVTATTGAELAGGTESPGAPTLGRDLGELAGIGTLGLQASEDALAVFEASDVVIDFTRPEPTRRHAELAARTGTALVIGTTGLAGEHEAAIRQAAEKSAIVQAPNMSVGVTLLRALTEQVARILDESYDIEIVEMHHRHKVDAPSGTALALGRSAAAGRGVDLEAATVAGRFGETGPRQAGDIGFAVLRGGDVVGDHSVIFAADGERIELSHKASSRRVFARGAVRAALWAAAAGPGLYSMEDVLGLGDR